MAVCEHHCCAPVQEALPKQTTRPPHIDRLGLSVGAPLDDTQASMPKFLGTMPC